jgi:hypothetical protein
MTHKTPPAIQAITNALLALPAKSAEASFACRLTVPVECLALEVKGVGKVRLPVTANRAKTLIKSARQAPFGRKDKTLTDPTVRDAWEIAKSRVKIDNRVWNQALNPALEQIGEQLGLDQGQLKADLYKMLIYRPGQFFVPHRDSEKDDHMIATLVVVLPCAHRGGVLQIEHQGSTKSFHSNRLAADKLGLFAFYADCRHELKPVTEGYRIALTYNLSYKPKTGRRPGKPPTPASRQSIIHLQTALGDYLSSTRQSQPLVVLLDHQYSQRSLRWSQLKNLDRARALALEDALDKEFGRDGYHLNLALLTLQEIWHATDERYDPYHRGRRYYNSWDDDWDDEDEENHNHLTLHDLIERYARLEDWRARDNKTLPLGSLVMTAIPAVACIPIHELKPASSYYEDYTGNAGNTLDRTYHRAAVVIWTDRNHSKVLADISLTDLFEYWTETLAGKPASDYVAALSSFDLPERLSRHERDPDTLAFMMKLLAKCDRRDLAINHLRPFSLHALTIELFPAITQLGRLYGKGLLEDIFREWTADDRYRWRWFDWAPALERFISHCKANADPPLTGVPIMLFDRFYDKCRQVANDRLRRHKIYEEDGQLDSYSGAELAAVCHAAMKLGDAKRIQSVQDFVLKNAGFYDSAGLVQVLKNVDSKIAKGFHQQLSTLLEDRLQREADSHIRDSDDWRVAHTITCNCDFCNQLKTFLDHRDQRKLDIPAAKDKRLHLHRMIDSQGLPVSHTTTRTGRPFTLNLAKKRDLFSREKKLRQIRLDLLRQVKSSK